MPESWKTRLFRWGFNFFPAFRGTGGRVTYIAHDWSEVRVKLPLNWRTRNYVGSIFGGSIYGAVDPHFMIMLIKRLGPEYIVWDKAAAVRFKKPGRSTLFARFLVPDAEVAAIREILRDAPKAERIYQLELSDASGQVCAEVEKTLYIRRRRDGEESQ
jgi:acyl-coenzyme A thioesterase PaaI-like protein